MFIAPPIDIMEGGGGLLPSRLYIYLYHTYLPKINTLVHNQINQNIFF